MDMHMEVHFNSLVNESFTIVNPPVIPNTGDMVNFDFTEFIKNKAALRKIEDYLQTGVFIAERISIHYYKNHVQIIVALLEEKHFNKEYMKLRKLRMN